MFVFVLECLYTCALVCMFVCICMCILLKKYLFVDVCLVNVYELLRPICFVNNFVDTNFKSSAIAKMNANLELH